MQDAAGSVETDFSIKICCRSFCLKFCLELRKEQSLLKKFVAKKIAWLLALVLMIPSMTSYAAGTVLETAPEIAEMGLTVGQGLIDTYLAADDTIACRDDEGWTQDASAWSCGLPKGKNSDGNYSWGWWRGNASDTSTSVTGFNTLSLTAYQTDSVILLPTLPSTNYKFEATFTVVGTQDGETVTTPNGSFGLVTNIGPTYEESIGGTRFGAYTTGNSNGESKNRVFVHNKSAKASIGEELYESKQTNKDNLEGYTAPSAGDAVTLTVYAYEGTNYYYINGIYVFSFDSKLTTEGESLGKGRWRKEWQGSCWRKHLCEEPQRCAHRFGGPVTKGRQV